MRKDRATAPRETLLWSGGRSELEATETHRGLRRPKAHQTDKKRQNLSRAIASYPTLRQAWSGECPGPQYAFKMSMFNVSCNSH